MSLRGHRDDCAKVLASDRAWTESAADCDCSPTVLRERAKELERALRLVLDSAKPDPMHHPTMSAAWAHAKNVLERK